MKHLLKTSLLLLALLLPVTAIAHNFEVDGIYYNINGNNVTVTFRGTSYDQYSSEYSGDVTIPATVAYNGTNYSVTSIGESALRGCTGLTSVTIPSSVTGIGQYAFYGCTGLTSITIPSSVTGIGQYAFYGCTGLTSITIPSSVTGIGQYAFYGCTGLTSITIPESVTGIGQYAFYGCTGLTSITIPESVTSIGDYAFSSCSGLESISVNANNTVFDSRNNCNAIIKKSTNQLLVGCKNTIIQSSVTGIGNFAFYGCSELTSIMIPSNVTSIGNRAFYGCNGLDNVYSGIIDPSLIDMGSDVFYRNPNNYTSRKLYVPSVSMAIYQADTKWNRYFGSIERIGINFSDANVEAICVQNWDTNGDGDLSKTEAAAVTNLNNIFENNTAITSFDELHYFTGLSNISESAFQGCTSLTSITIPSSVTTISASAFQGCTSLTSITIPSSVTTISTSAFQGCISLTSITIPSSVTTISASAFQGCTDLTSIGIPKNVNFIGNKAFYGCSKLDVVCSNIFNPSLIYMGSDVFYRYPNNYDSRKLYVPSVSLAIYQTDTKWSQYFGSIEKGINFSDANVEAICVQNWDTNGDGVLGIDEAAAVTSLNNVFRNNATIKSFDELRYFTGLTNINENAFQYCSKLTSITIPESVTTIGNSAFNGCTVLKNINIPNSVTSIGESAFGGCAMTSVTIPTSVTSIGRFAFSMCSAMQTLNFNAVSCADFNYSSNHPFYRLYHISTINIGNSVQKIPANFAYDLQITEITIPSSVTSIGACAFYECLFLESVTCLATTPPSWSSLYLFSSEIYADIPLYVPTGSVNAYKADQCWGQFNTIIGIESVLATGISFNQSQMNLLQGSSSQLTATVLPDSTTNKVVSWASSAPNVASVNDNGLVTALTVGTATITATTTDGSNLSASCVVTVNSNVILATSISLNETEAELTKGGSMELTATVLPSNTTNKTVTWYSSNPAVASVDNNGLVTALSVGTATITATTTDGSNLTATCMVTVNPNVILATSISLNETEAELTKGRSMELTATVLPSNTTNKTLIWSSNNPTVASVDNNGLVTALGVGTATITATTTDGSNLSASCVVTVNDGLSNYDNYLSIEDVEAFHGDTIVIPVKMTNDESIISFQTDIFLPEGLELLKEDGEYIIDSSERMTRTHSIMSDDVSNGAIRVLCYSSNYKPFTGNSGDDLFYLTVKVADIAEGDYAIQLKNTLFTTSDFEEIAAPDVAANVNVKAYLLGDANNSGSVTVTDVVVTSQYILEQNPNPFVFEAADVNIDGNITITDVSRIAWMVLNPTLRALLRAPAMWNNGDRMSGSGITLATGETRRVSIMLDNEMDYAAFQLDLNLPAGLTASNFELTDRAGSHAFDVNTLQNGNIRALCYSPAMASINGHEGALLTFDVTATAPVIGDITVDGIELVTTACQTVKLDGFTIGVNNTSSVNETVNGKAIAKVEYFNLAGQRIDRPENGVTLVVTTYTDGTRANSKLIR